MGLKRIKELENLVEFNNKLRPKQPNESAYVLCEGQELILNAFKSGIYPVKATQGEGLKILTLKQTIQRLSIALAQVKAGNIWTFIKYNQKNNIFFVSSKRNY